MAEITITKSNFESEVLSSDKPVLVDFWASWCGPCRMLAPVVAQIADARDDVKVGKINVDEQPELAARYSVSSIPTVLVFKDGKVAASSVGYRPRPQIEALLGGFIELYSLPSYTHSLQQEARRTAGLLFLCILLRNRIRPGRDDLPGLVYYCSSRRRLRPRWQERASSRGPAAPG